MIFMPIQRDTARRPFLVVVGIALILASVMIRLSWYPIAVSDYVYFVQQWLNWLHEPGLSAFAQPFSDYAPTYLYLLKILTFLPIDGLYSSKTLSFIFEIIIAWLAATMIRRFSPIKYSTGALFLIFAVFLCIPTFALNSSLWGQSDAVYAAPILASLLCILLDMPLAAALLFGVAISIKAQALFFAPVLLGYLLKDKLTAWYLALPPLVFAVSILPAALFGGNFFYWLTIYAKEGGEYPYLSVSSPSIFAFVNNLPLSASTTDLLFWGGIVIACAIALTIGIKIYKTPVQSASLITLASLACVLLIPYFLPRMHERYFFLADMLSVLHVFFAPRRWYLPILIVGSSLLAYMPYLSSQVSFLASVSIDLRIPALILAVAGIIVAVDLWKIHPQQLETIA